MEMTSVTLTNEFGRYEIHSTQACDDIWEVADNLIIPLLLAAGYQRETINELFEGSDNEMLGEVQ